MGTDDGIGTDGLPIYEPAVGQGAAWSSRGESGNGCRTGADCASDR